MGDAINANFSRNPVTNIKLGLVLFNWLCTVPCADRVDPGYFGEEPQIGSS